MRSRAIWSVCALFLGTVSAYGQSGQPVPIPLCHRTAQVRSAVQRAICPKCSCKAITQDQLKQLRELSLAGIGLTELRIGDFSGLISLEKLDLTETHLKALPESLPAELESLRNLRLDLSLFTQLPDRLLQPLLERPGFAWEIPYPARTCGRYEPTAKEQAPLISMSELETVLQLSSTHREVDVRAWKARRNVYLVGVVTDMDELELFAVSMGTDKRPSLLARAERPIKLAGGYSYEFDLAPYRLTDGEVGFGIRRSREESVPNNQTADEEELQVFRVHGNKLERVLKTIVYRQYTRDGSPSTLANDNAVEPGDWQWEERFCSVVAVAKSKTDGVFNWVKVSSTESTRKDTAADEKSHTCPAMVFRWNGEHYEARNDEKKSYFFGGD